MIRLLTHSKTCLKSSSSSTTNSIVSKITQKLNFSTSTSTGSNLAAVTSLSLPGGTIHSHTKRDVLLSASSSPSSLTFSGGQNCLTSSLYQSSPSALAAYTQSKPSLIHPVGSSPLIIEAFTYIATRATSLFFAGAGVTWSYLKAREEWNKRYVYVYKYIYICVCHERI